MKNALLGLMMLCAAGTTFAQDTAYKMKMKLGGHKADVEAVAFSPDGKFLASGGWDNDMRVYRADTPGFGNEVMVLRGHVAGITTIAYSRDGKYLASGSKDFSIRVYEAATGKLVFTANDHKESVTRVLFDPKAKYVMSSSIDGTIRMYDLVEPKNNAKPRFVKFSGPVNGFVPSIDGKTFYVASNKAAIDNIDFKATVLRSLSGHTDAVNSVELSPDGKMLASGSNDKTVIIWDLATGKALKVLKGHVWKVTSVSWSSDGQNLVSTGNEGETIVWDVNSGQLLATIKKPGYNARSAAFNNDCGMIAIATMMAVTDFGPVLFSTPLKKLVLKPGAKGAGAGVGAKGATPGAAKSANPPAGKPAAGGKPAGASPAKPK